MTREAYLNAAVAQRAINDFRIIHLFRELYTAPWPFSDVEVEPVTEKEREEAVRALKRRSAFREVREGG